MPGGLPEVVQKFSIDSSGYDAGLARMIAGNKDLVKSIGDVQRKVKELAGDLGALPDRKIKVEVTGVDDAIAKTRALKGALDALGDRSVRVDVDTAGALAKIAAVKSAMAGIGNARGNVNVTGGGPGIAAATQLLKDHADAADLAARAVRRQAAAVRKLDRDLQHLQVTAGNVSGGGILGPAITIGGGGGGGNVGITIAGGGGSGGGGGGRGSFVPWAGGGWQAVKFWGMAIAEFAATAVPALIAAGSAAAVGMQGAQDVMLRAKALGAAAQSIGPAYGQSVSTYLGTSGAFSQYADQARGGVYELAGAGINFARMGKGTFGQLGLNTLAMIDRGSANMLLNYQARQAAGKGMGDMLSGGTEWLRRYGDLFSNLGSTVMNLAPYEPGLGGDVLNTLVGGTGLLKQVTQDVPGPVLGAIMAAEGGARWGKAILGGKGLLGRVLGLGKVGGLGGLLTKGGEALMGTSSPFLAGTGYGLAGIGDFLATSAGPLSIAAALSAYGMSYLASTMPTAAQRKVAGLQAGIGQAGFSGAWQPLANAIVTTRGLAATSRGGSLLSQEQQVQTPYEIGRFGPGITPTYAQTYAAAATGFGQTMTNLIGSGPQLVDALHKAGLKSVSMGDAFQIAQNSLLDLTHAFDKHGHLTKTATQMLSNYVSGIAPMTRSGGAFNAAIDAQQIMSSPAMKSLSQVNQAMDSMTQIMSGGPAGMATLFGMLGGTPITHKNTKAGLQLQAPPAFKAMANALTSFSSASGAAAWNTFAGSSGLIAAEQQNLDQIRTALTLGAIGATGSRTAPFGQAAAGLAGFQLQQLLPLARKSPAALAMLMQQGQQMGIGGYYDPSKTQGQNYAAEQKALASIADSAKQANAQTNDMTVSLSRLPKLAQQFSQGFKADVMSNQVAAAASSFSQITSQAMKGAIDKGAISSLTGQLKVAFGGNMGAVRAQIQQALSTSGLSAAMQKKIMIQVDANTGPAQAKISALHGKQVTVQAMAAGVAAVQAAINSVHGKSVTIQVTTINTEIFRQIGALTPAGGVAPMTPVGGGANMRIRAGAQTGRKIPGYGGGDIYPAMLEPGETVLPKHATSDPMTLALAAKYHIPGFAAGGVVGQPAYGPSSYWGAGSQMALWNPALLAAILAAMRASQGQGQFAHPSGTAYMPGSGGAGGATGPAALAQAAAQAAAAAAAAMQARKTGSQFSVEILKGMRDGLKHAGPEARKLASALVGKLEQEVAYAKGVSSAMKQGLNLGGMDVTPGTGNGTVQEQMQSYLGSMQAFSGDLGKLKKGHLNKDLMDQIVAAGPVQGDALAQSILSGAGGIKGANKLDNQIGKLANKIGVQAANAKYGDHLSPDLKSAQMTTNNITVNVQMPAHGGGDLQLTNQQINQLINIIQKKLLQQAKRNNKTGVKLPGKGS